MKKTIEFIITTAIPLMLVFAGMFVFIPGQAFELYDVIPGESHGRNSLKSDIGGFVLSYAILAYIFLRTKSADILKALMVLTGAISIMRLLSIIIDGVNMWGIGWLGLEVFSFILMYYYLKKFVTNKV